MRATGLLFSGRTILVGSLAGSLGLMAVIAATPANAATTFTVTTTADVAANAGACGNASTTSPPSPLSLREATCLANNVGGAVTINIPAGTYSLSNGELAPGLAAGSNVSLIGAGAAATVITAHGASRVIDLDKNLVGGVTTTMTALTVTGGADSTFGGAGIIAGSGNAASADSLTLSGVVVTGNAANGADLGVTNRPGGGIQFIGGRLTILDSTISNNSSGSSYGAGLAYGAEGAATPEGLTISNTTFSGNATANAHGDTGTAIGGAALATFGPAGFSVSGSSFVNNTATSTAGSGAALGAAIWSQSGNLAVFGSSFSSNGVSGGPAGDTGGAIEVTSGGAVLHYDRFVGNSAPTGSAVRNNSGTVDATENWFGCNAGPGGIGCDTVAGTVSVSPRLVLTATASPATVIGPNGSATITAALTTDSAGNAVSAADLGAFGSLPVTFADPPGDATVTAAAGPHSAGFSNGVASIDYHSGATTTGPDPDSITFDNATISALVTVDEAPLITSASTAAFTLGTAGSVTVTAVGFPAPSISESGALPSGLTFTDNGNGSATLAGSATVSGTFPVTITAGNGVSPNANQSLTVTVGGPPVITSAASTTFTAGVAGSFTVTSTGSPTPAVGESGPLPSGLTFTDNGDGTATVAGTPAPGSGGAYPVTVTASNGTSPDATQHLIVQVNDAPAAPTSVSAVVTGNTAQVSWTAPSYTGGAPLVSFAVTGTDTATAATVTAGVTGNPPATTVPISGLLAGHTYAFTVTATNTEALSSIPSAPSDPVGAGSPPSISGAPPAGTVGSGYSFVFNATGSPAPTISATGTLPPGLSLTSAGLLSGTPTTAGSFDFTVLADNGIAPSAAEPVTVAILASVPGAPTGVSAVAGSTSATVSWSAPTDTGGSPILSYTVTGTDITHSSSPASVTVEGAPVPTSALVSGLNAGDAYRFIVVATTAAGSSIASAPSAPVTPFLAPTIAGTPSGATVGVGYSFSFTTTGYPAPTVSATGALPPGLTLSAAGVLAGTPTTTGSYSFTVSAANGHAPDASRTISVTVASGAPASVSVVAGSNQAGTAGAPFDTRLAVTVSDSYANPVSGVSVTFTVTSGSASFPGGAKSSVAVSTSAGVATAPVLTAGKTAGPVTVTASAPGAVPATFNETVLSVGKAKADLAVSVSSPASAAKSSTFTISVTVKNRGPNAATSMLTSVNLGTGLSVVSASGGSVYGGSVLYASSGLAVNASVTYVLTVKAGKNAVTTGILAGALSVVPDPVLSNNLVAARLRIS